MARDEAHQGAHAPANPITPHSESDIDEDADARDAATRSNIPDQQRDGSTQVHAHRHGSGCGITGHSASHKLDF